MRDAKENREKNGRMLLTPRISRGHFLCPARLTKRITHDGLSERGTTRSLDNVTTPNYLFFALLSVKWSLTGRLKTEQNFKLLALKEVAVAYERWLLTRGSKYSDLTWKRLVF